MVAVFAGDQILCSLSRYWNWPGIKHAWKQAVYLKYGIVPVLCLVLQSLHMWLDLCQQSLFFFGSHEIFTDWTRLVCRLQYLRIPRLCIEDEDMFPCRQEASKNKWDHLKNGNGEFKVCLLKYFVWGLTLPTEVTRKNTSKRRFQVDFIERQINITLNLYKSCFQS